MLIVKPKLRAAAIRKLPAKEAHAARQLFNTERSKSDMEAFTLADITDAVYPECSSGVVFRYSHEGVETQYEPYDDINVGMTVKCQSTECDKRLMFVSLLEIGKSCSRPEDFTLPVYSDADREDIQLQTRGQADNRLWYLMREGRISASIAHDVYTKAVKFMAVRCGFIPEHWKKAIVTPIPKCHPLVNASDFRPISVQGRTQDFISGGAG